MSNFQSGHQRHPVAHPYEEALADVRTRALRSIAVGEMILAFVIVFVWAANSELTGPESLLVGASLALSSGAAWTLADRDYGGALIALVGGGIASIIVAAMLWSTPDVVDAIPLLLLVSPLYKDFRHGLLTGAIGIGTIGLIGVQHVVPMSPMVVGRAVILVAVATGLAWVAHEPSRAMIVWTWGSYLDERRKIDEVRARQAELAELSKSLTDACKRLEQANLALSVARRQADEARRQKEEFAMAISHELRTPINLIIGFSEMIVNDPREDVPPALARDVETIYRNAGHLSTLVDDILDLGRLDARRLGLVKRWCALPSIVDEAVQAVRGLYDNAGLQMRVEIPPGLPPLFLDPTRLRQVLINLLTNAVRYVEEGHVAVRAHSEGSDTVVEVVDTGIGIAAEDLPHVFERFHQTGHACRRGGFGLGLTVSKQLIEMHGGSMWVTSTVNRGTTFSFTLPRTTNVVNLAENPRLPLLEARVPGRDNQRTVLVLGEDPDAVRVFERYLDGYHLCLASTLEEVVAVARREVASAIVIANQVSDELADAARERFSDIPTFACTLRTIAHAENELNVAAFLTKPVVLEGLRAVLRRLKLQPCRALVVDDDPDMVQLLTRMLRTCSPCCVVNPASSVREALELAQLHPPDVILLDLLMPELDGHAMIEAARAVSRLEAVPIIVISAASDKAHNLVVGETVEIRRPNGLSVADMVGVISSSLDYLQGDGVRHRVD